ncbi:hypothetical protein [Paractinoplanes brasiliensis]|uniref:hypothetical protein n=1 Tax=Paractinoplanes brasiliensis TaxID=52695 RepID=UPI0014151978|nr:hypothetical protein [Actinoplanes brasiliensis]
MEARQGGAGLALGGQDALGSSGRGHQAGRLARLGGGARVMAVRTAQLGPGVGLAMG